MKTITQILLGLTSSLLLSAGLVRAAEKLDPVSNLTVRMETFASVQQDGPSMACVAPCALAGTTEAPSNVRR